jgi:hypothetical protein
MSPNSAMPVVIARRGIYLEDVGDFIEVELSRAARVYGKLIDLGGGDRRDTTVGASARLGCPSRFILQRSRD